MSSKQRLEKLQFTIFEAFEIVERAFDADLKRPYFEGVLGAEQFRLIAFGHVLTALIQDIDAAEAAR